VNGDVLEPEAMMSEKHSPSDRLRQTLEVYNAARPENRAPAVRAELERQKKAKANPKQAVN
jgi:hypothetical protein